MRYNIPMKEKIIAIIGGGAGGMLCAHALAAGGTSGVVLVERGARLGRKLSATGNGQGNVTNLHMDEGHYFSDDLPKVGRILREFSPVDLIGRLGALGGMFESDEQGRVYPCSRQAAAVTDLLRFALDRAGVKCLSEHTVDAISAEKGKYVLRFAEGGTLTADLVVFATGGQAAKNFGTDGKGYALARSLGHTVTPLFPALVQLKTDTAHIRGLKGVRVNCLARAFDGQKETRHARGDVIFTDYGVSGNAIFLLSSHLTDAASPRLTLDFLPDRTEKELTVFLQKKASFCPRESLLGCVLPGALGRAVLRRAAEENGGGFMPDEAARLVKNYSLRVTGTLGFDGAQVTRGGVPLSETDEGLQSLRAKNVYFCGEILNVDGECGGYNLHWAFASAMRVARDILRRTGQFAPIKEKV